MSLCYLCRKVAGVKCCICGKDVCKNDSEQSQAKSLLGERVCLKCQVKKT